MYLTKDEIDRSLAVLKAKMEKGQIILDCDLLESGAEYTFTAVCVSISTIRDLQASNAHEFWARIRGNKKGV